MKNLKLLWVEDDANFPESVIYRLNRSLEILNVSFIQDTLTNGKNVWEVVRDWQPDIIMMDHNLEDISVNGAELIVHIRFHNNYTPIIFYSSEMGPSLTNMVKGESEIYISPRGDVSDELLRLVQDKFASI